MPALSPISDAMVQGLPVAQAGSVRSPEEIFQSVFLVFLVLGTLVGVVVIIYMIVTAYKYRDGDGDGVEAGIERPQMGEIPQGGGGGKKLFLSFGISAIIVLGLILWTYGLLLDVEQGTLSQEAKAQTLDNPMEVQVIGSQFSWTFVYPNGERSGTLRVPVDRAIQLNVTSVDVWHNFGIDGLGQKADAQPGRYTSTWFRASETGNHTARCYELCGTGHSIMTAEVRVLPQEEFRSWYNSTAGTNQSTMQTPTPTPNDSHGTHSQGEHA